MALRMASKSFQDKPCSMYSMDAGLKGPLILSIEAIFAVVGRTGSPGSVAVGLIRDDENPWEGWKASRKQQWATRD